MEVNPTTVDFRSNMPGHNTERAFKELSNALSRCNFWFPSYVPVCLKMLIKAKYDL